VKVISKTLNFKEAKDLLEHLGFKMLSRGKKSKASDSRITFIKGDSTITLHKSHLENNLKKYQIAQLVEYLEERGLLS